MKKTAHPHNEFSYSLPDKPNIDGSNFLNTVRPTKKQQKIFERLAKGKKLTEVEEKALDQMTRNLWRLREASVRYGHESEEKQIEFVYSLVSRLIEYSKTINLFSLEIMQAEKMMASLDNANPEFIRLQGQNEFKMAAIQQNRLMIKRIQEELKKIPEYFSKSALAGKIMAILSPLGLLTSFNPDIGIMQDQRAEVSKKALNALDTARYDEDWMEDDSDIKSTDGGLAEMSDAKPDMDSDGKGGELEKGISFGSFEFANEYFKDAFDGKLWVTKVKNSEGSLREYIYQQSELDRDQPTTVASVKLNIENPVSNVYSLPYLIGTNVVNVKVEPESANGYIRSGNSISFASSLKPNSKFQVSYDLALAGDGALLSYESDNKNGDLQLVTNAEEAVDKLKKNPDRASEILRDYLGNFTYVTSRQLQKLLDDMPGSFQEKIQNIRFGDCDMLSDHGSYILQRGEVPAVTTLGYIDLGENSFFPGNAHGQILFETAKGLEEFESTGVASTNGAYSNLRFKKNHYLELQKIVEDAKSANSPQARIQAYQNFDQALRKILNSAEYDRFRVHNEMRTLMDTINDMARYLSKQVGWKNLANSIKKLNTESISHQEDFLTRLDEQIEKEFGPSGAWTFRILLLLLFCASVGGLAFATGKGIEKYSEFYADTERKKIRDRINMVAKRIVDHQGGEDHHKESSPTTLLVSDEIYKRAKPDARHFFHLIEDIFNNTGPEQLVRYLFYNKAKWSKALSALEQLGYDSRKTMDYFRSLFEQQKFREFADKERQKDKEEIVKYGYELTSKFMHRFPTPKSSDHSKIQSQILHLRRTGDKETSKRKSQLGHDSSSYSDSRPYQAGDNLRDLDIHYYARSDELRTRTSNTRAESDEKPKKRFILVINIDSVINRDLSRLHALLNYAQKYPNEVHIDKIELYANGRRLTLEEAPMQTSGKNNSKVVEALMKSGPEGLQNIQKWIKSLVDLRWAHAWHIANYVYADYGLDFFHTSRFYFGNRRDADAKRKGENLLFVGRGYSAPDDDNFYQIY